MRGIFIWVFLASYMVNNTIINNKNLQNEQDKPENNQEQVQNGDSNQKRQTNRQPSKSNSTLKLKAEKKDIIQSNDQNDDQNDREDPQQSDGSQQTSNTSQEQAPQELIEFSSNEEQNIQIQNNDQSNIQDLNEEGDKGDQANSSNQQPDDEETNEEEGQNDQNVGESNQQEDQLVGQSNDEQQVDISNAQKLKESFNNYQSKFSKEYKNQDEIVFRFIIYSDNAKKLNNHNNKNTTYRIKINQYADQTVPEFQSKYLMKNLGKSPKVKGVQLIVPEEFDIIPVDWRVRNATSPLRRQGQCGSCWAFTITGILESHLFIRKKRPLKLLSVQQLVDCCEEAGFKCYGCEGSWPGHAIQYAAQDGVANAEDYPYTGLVQPCKKGVETNLFLNRKNPFNQVKGVTQLAFALLSGPVGVVVDSSLWDPLYERGVFNDCNPDIDFNHAVIVVGIDQKGVWTIRNSWGKYWGEGGHIRLPPGNSCGVTDWGLVPILDDQ